MKNALTIFQKQLKDTLKNKEVLIQFIMFPVMAVIMTNIIHIEGMPRTYFPNLFASMFIGMSPLTSMASIIAEEKEKNTLRVLLMSNVHPIEYLLGVGCYIWLICMLGSSVFCVTGGYQGKQALFFLLAMAAGILTSLTIGAAIGTWSKNQMAATSLTVPVMMLFSFLPMLSTFNETIAKIAKVTYSQQVNLLFSQIHDLQLRTENVVIISLNMAIAFLLFFYAYKKSGLA